MSVSTLTQPYELLSLLQVGRTVYERDPSWVQPLGWIRIARVLALGVLNSEPKARALVVRREGQPVACGLVMRDSRHNQHRNENVVFLGYFDAVDRASGQQLLTAAADLARCWGATTLRGPRGFTRIDERGVLVEGCHLAPMMAGHHPSWYQDLFEQFGFTPHHDALAYAVSLVQPDGAPAALPPRLARKAAAVDIAGLEIRPCQYRTLLQDIDLAHTIMVEGFRDVPDNTPLPRAHFRMLGAALLCFTNRNMLQLALVNGKPVGFALCFPELNEALISARGRMSPLAGLRFLRGLGQVRTASFKLLGIVPEYRGTGLHAALIRAAIEGVQQAGYDRLEASLIDQRNRAMRYVVETAGMDVYRRYRVYDLEL